MSGIFSSFGISASGMAAERLRLDVIAENLANADSTKGADGTPYKRKEVVLAQAPGSSFGDVLNGVQVSAIASDTSPGKRVYDPGHPDADPQGYVTLPNVNPVTEMVDMISAQRSYDANVQAMNTAKSMFSRALDLLR
ncbi:MAG: flagellar basal body rod protein FlgC [Gaiellaceae bacterium]